MPRRSPLILTEAFLSAIRTSPALPRHTWYFIAGTTLSALNRPEEVPGVFRHAIERGVDSPADEMKSKPSSASASPSPSQPNVVDEQRYIARRMREALMKASVVHGLPKTINSLFELKKATPEALLDEPLTYSPSGRQSDFFDTPSSQVLHRGKVFFDKVYGKIASRVMGQMDRSGTEDLGLVARLMYGYILSNTRILNPAETSMVVLASLIPQDVNAQLKGHLVGATHHEGVSVEEVKAVRDLIIKICEASGMQLLGEDENSFRGWREPVANL